MSISALKLACRDAIRAVEAVPDVPVLREGECGVTSLGKPHPRATGLFIAVHGGGAKEVGREGGYYLHEALDVMVTISIRAGYVPGDMRGEGVSELESGLDRYTELVKTALHMNLAVASAANTLIPDGDQQEFVVGVPLRFRSAADPQERDCDWWAGDGNNRFPAGRQVGGISQTLRFQGIERIRKMGELS